MFQRRRPVDCNVPVKRNYLENEVGFNDGQNYKRVVKAVQNGNLPMALKNQVYVTIAYTSNLFLIERPYGKGEKKNSVNAGTEIYIVVVVHNKKGHKMLGDVLVSKTIH